MDKFTVKSIEGAKKLGYVVARVVYGNNKEYTFIRKFYPGNTIDQRYFIIEGMKVTYNKYDYSVISITQEYETAGKKVTNTSNKSVSESIKEELKEKAYPGLEVEEPQQEVKEEVVDLSQYETEVFHEKFNVIKACIENSIPVYLAGPAGSGKNHTLEQVAKQLNLDFYFTNSVQQEYKLTGFIDAGGNYHETEFYKAFTNGGLFFLDEMDASIPEVLVLLNAAIANGYFEFPIGKVTANENFKVVAAGNTVGSGANEKYTGRLVLDQATLDRFAIIEFDYDKQIELALSKGNKDLVDFIHSLRERADKANVRSTFSYRCITMVTKLEAIGMNLVEIMKIAVVKGLDIDSINTLKSLPITNKYTIALGKVA